MDNEAITLLKEFGIALIESQHEFFIEESIDNSEHVPAIKRIADTAYQYLIIKGVSPDISKKVKKELINFGRELFINEWMTPLDEDEENERKQYEENAKRSRHA